METIKKFYRPRNGKVIGGVCAAIANYFNFDPTILRIFWALTVLLAGTGFIIYLVCWLLIPIEPYN